jgi:cytochrome P450
LYDDQKEGTMSAEPDEASVLEGMAAMFGGIDPAALNTAEPQPLYQEICTTVPFRKDGFVVLTRLADVMDALKRPEIVSHPPDRVGGNLGSDRPLIPLDLDGDEHRKYRKLLDPLFAPRVVAALEPRVRRLADELIDDFVDRDEVEMYDALCVPLPTTIFLELLGLPRSDLQLFLDFKDAAIRPKGETFEECMAYQREMVLKLYDYLNRELDRREAAARPGADLIGGFLTVEVDGDRLTRENIIDIVYLLVIAGLDTVTASLSCIIAWFATHPEARARIVADESLLPAAIEELMRFESPVPFGGRFAIADVEINGQQVKAGDFVSVLWAAANADPEGFDDPLTVDLQRAPNRHVAFAAGFHRCLGSHLARLELRVALEQLHRRIPHYEIAPGQEPVYAGIGVRTVSPLPIKFHSGTVA